MSLSKISNLWHRLQIKINLEGMKPPVWRRLIVDSRIPLDALHLVIQTSMGWSDSHMHQFIDRDNNIYGEADPEFTFSEINSEENFTLGELLKKEKNWLFYDYDFGDDWRHKIILEKILPPDNNVVPVQCIKGMRVCPPEDCGGVWGYQRLVEIIGDPEHEEYQEIIEWIDEEFIADAKFNLPEVQKLLEDQFSGVKFSSRSKKKPVQNKNLEKILETDFNLVEEILNDPDIPEELKAVFSQMVETFSIIEEMSEMIELNYQAFETILSISKEVKVKKMAQQMIDIMDELD